MKKLSIRPVLEFISAQGRKYLTSGDWAQLREKIQRQRAEKKLRGEDVTKEDIYLMALAHVDKLFAHQAKVPNAKILPAIDRFLRGQNLKFDEEIHPARHRRNIFYAPEQKAGTVQSYDVAFYNHLAGRGRPAHHKSADKNFPSVYYIRCEVSEDQILIGNLQIDDTMPEYWDDPAVGRVLLQPKNLHGMMIQQALRHAVNAGKKEILFQCGDANDLSQWGCLLLKESTVTPQNYKKFRANYQSRLDKFGPEGVLAGQILLPSKENSECYQYVLERGPGYYKTHETPAGGNYLLNLLMFGYEKINKHVESNFDYALSGVVSEAEDNIYTALLARKPAKALDHLDALIARITGARPLRTDRPAKIKMLRQSALSNDGDSIKSVIDNFIEKWGYDKIILAHYPDIVKFNLRAPSPHLKAMFYYYNKKDEDNLRVYRENQLKVPEIGKTYWTMARDKYNINFFQQNPPNARYYKIHRWYEKIVPAELKRHKLKYEKITINTVRRGKPCQAHAWKITGGIAEFKKRPLAVFATGTEFQMDCETLPRLQQAAQKFGGELRQLKIINELLLDNGTARLGKYHLDADEITLANRSLSVMAHEGLHRLKAKGLIPAKEYRALVAAGRQIAQRVPTVAKYINQRDENNQLRYPPGPARTEELAAVFVQTYYKNNALARRCLCGQRIPVVRRVLNYVCTVADIVAGQLGHAPALARCFLRRVERGEFAAPMTRKPLQVKSFPGYGLAGHG